MLIGGPASPVLSAVQRSQATGITTACSDRNHDGNGLFSAPVHGGRVTIGLSHADRPLLGTRWAGPLDADITAALPARTLSLNQIRHGRTTIDLTGSRRFAARGLAGTVDSTLVLFLGRPQRGTTERPSVGPRHFV